MTTAVITTWRYTMDKCVVRPVTANTLLPLLVALNTSVHPAQLRPPTISPTLCLNPEDIQKPAMTAVRAPRPRIKHN